MRDKKAGRFRGDVTDQASSSPLDLFGNPDPRYRPPAARQDPPTPAPKAPPLPPAAAQPKSEPASTEGRPMPAGLTEQAIASFGSAGIEARFDVPDLGEVWLVSRRTGQDRVELTAGDLASLARLVTVFDGARVVAIESPASA